MIESGKDPLLKQIQQLQKHAAETIAVSAELAQGLLIASGRSNLPHKNEWQKLIASTFLVGVAAGSLREKVKRSICSPNSYT